MQIDKKDYNPELHDKYKCLSVKQPYADLLTVITFQDEEGNFQADKTIEVRSRNTKYRGEVLICSSAKPVIPLKQSGVTCGLVELYDVKKVEDFTEQDWIETCIPVNQRPRKGYGWLMRNPRRVVEMPIKGQLGFYDIILPKDDLTEYPRVLKIDKQDRQLINDKINGTMGK